MSQVAIQNLGLRYQNNWVFKQLSTTINPQEFVSILGTSGCGKSSLLNILSGILSPNEGAVVVDNQIVDGLNPFFAYMPQDDLLFDWKTVAENISLYQSIHSLTIDHDLIDDYLAIFGLSDVKDAYPEELSGGMRQRVAFLRTVLVERDILLLDEPFGALDVFTRHSLQDWLKKVAETLNKTIILVTHDIDEALYLSDRILIMGESPSTFVADIDLSDEQQSREWLANQGKMRQYIFDLLSNKGEQPLETP